MYPPKREKAVLLGNVNPENYQILTHPDRKQSIVTRRYGDQSTHIVLMDSNPIEIVHRGVLG